MSLADLHALMVRADQLAYHVTEEAPDVPESVVDRVIALQLEAGAAYSRAKAAADAADELRQARLDDARRDAADERDALRAWRDES